MKFYLNNYTLHSQYTSPSCSEKVLNVLESLFYWGGHRYEILAKDKFAQKLICISNEGRKVSTVEKILKVILYLFIPVVLIALLLRSLLRCVVFKNYDPYLIENSVPSEAYLTKFLEIRSKCLELYRSGLADNSYIERMRKEGITLINLYKDGGNEVFTIAFRQFPGVTFTFVSDKKTEDHTTVSLETTKSLLKHCLRTIEARNWVYGQDRAMFVPGVIGLSLRNNMLICCTSLTPDKITALSVQLLPETQAGRKPFQDCISKFFNFAIQSGCSGVSIARGGLLIFENQGICLPVIEDTGRFKNNFEDPVIKKAMQLEAIKQILLVSPEELLKELILEIPATLKSPELMHSLMGERLAKALNLNIDINKLKSFLNFLSIRMLQIDKETDRSVIVFQKFGGEDRLIAEPSIYGELFIKQEGQKLPSTGEVILKKMMEVGIIKTFSNNAREVWIYYD
ncbi:DUF648 domain-containing protein [Chlamydia sp. 17-3921]|uniref:DUF648 domain-containing protein n=1 Tax=Chlamydia sp. 17-3921 TaxID=2675798 RepID=UPI00191863A4|nr:DUF648 domain-containing protein [Chlamydia sp. 17-3921]